MESLPKFLRHRERLSSWYAARLHGRAPVEPIEKNAVWNRWMLSVQAPDRAGRDRILATLNRADIQARPLWRPVPMQKPYGGASGAAFPAARRAYETVVNIPSSTCLTEAQVDTVSRALGRLPLARLLI
jgi:dTDP-4-amino-4,6-dideoxygalactose transaminase